MVEKKRTVDNWKKKKWYVILADPIFDAKEIGKTIAIEGTNLKGRTLKKTLDSLTGNIKDSAYVITFKVDKVTGGKAETSIFDMEAKSGHLKRMIRRQKSKIEDIIYPITKDGKKLKLKLLFITGNKYSTQTRTEARNLMDKFFMDDIKERVLKEAWSEIIFQKISEKCKKKLTKLGFVNKIIVCKAKIME